MNQEQYTQHVKILKDLRTLIEPRQTFSREEPTSICVIGNTRSRGKDKAELELCESLVRRGAVRRSHFIVLGKKVCLVYNIRDFYRKALYGHSMDLQPRQESVAV